MNSILKIVSALKALSLPKTQSADDSCSEFVPMVELCFDQFKSVVGGSGSTTDGTPRGGW